MCSFFARVEAETMLWRSYLLYRSYFILQEKLVLVYANNHISDLFTCMKPFSYVCMKEAALANKTFRYEPDEAGYHPPSHVWKEAGGFQCHAEDIPGGRH